VSFGETTDAGTFSNAQVVPEPATVIVWSLLGLSVAGYSVWRRKRTV
jgi:hypothetical protein